MWFFLLITLCLASQPSVRLPVTEEPTDWHHALDEASLQIWRVTDPPAPIVAQPAGARWRVTVTDASGVARQVFLPPPHTHQERLDFSWLVASLLRPLPRLVTSSRTQPLPPQPSAPVTVPAPTPEVVAEFIEPVPPPEIAPGFENLQEEEIKGETLEVVIDVRPRVDVGRSSSPRQVLWARATPLLRLHEDGTRAPGGSISAGIGSSRLRWGAEVGWSGPVRPPEALPWSVRSLDLWGGVESQPREQVSLGLAVGSARRVWMNGDDRHVQPSVARLAFESGLRKPLGGPMTLIPTLRLEQDLAPTSLVVAGVPTGQISPTVIALRLNLEWEARAMDPSSAQDTLYP